MNLKKLAESILKPKDGIIAIDGNIGSSSPLKKVIGSSAFKYVLSGTFATAIVLGTAGLASAQNEQMFPLEIINPPPNIEVSFDKDKGSFFGFDDKKKDEFIKDLKNNEYSGKLNFNFELSKSYFFKIGKNINKTEGFDTEDFQGIVEESELLNDYIEKNSTNLLMSKKEVDSAREYIKNSFNYTLDDVGQSNITNLSDGDTNELADEILGLIKDNSDSVKLFHVLTDLSNRSTKEKVDAYNIYQIEKEKLPVEVLGTPPKKPEHTEMKSDHDMVVKMIKYKNRDNKLDELLSLDNLRYMDPTKGNVEDPYDLGFQEIYSNIAEHYNLDPVDIQNALNLAITVHEYTHALDVTHGISGNFLDKGDVGKLKQFNNSIETEAFADLNAIPIASAIYAKKIGVDPVKITDALTDAHLLFRASSFILGDGQKLDDFDPDPHIGAANAVLYWDSHRNDLVDEANKIYESLPDNMNNIDFDKVIKPLMLDIYNKHYLSEDFQNGSPVITSSEFDGFKGVKDDYYTSGENINLRLYDAIENMGYKAIFDGKTSEKNNGTFLTNSP